MALFADFGDKEHVFSPVCHDYSVGTGLMCRFVGSTKSGVRV
jgi:hypothetical protein